MNIQILILVVAVVFFAYLFIECMAFLMRMEKNAAWLSEQVYKEHRPSLGGFAKSLEVDDRREGENASQGTHTSSSPSVRLAEKVEEAVEPEISESTIILPYTVEAPRTLTPESTLDIDVAKKISADMDDLAELSISISESEL